MSCFKTFFISKILKQIIIREKTGNLPSYIRSALKRVKILLKAVMQECGIAFADISVTLFW